MSTPTPIEIGRFRIIRSLGVGGMGAVFLARDPKIDRLVAIKLMRQGFEVAQMRERFTREAQSIGRLHHPNVVTIFDVGEHDGAPFIAMEYVEGQTLAGLIRHEPDLSIGRKLALMDGLCAGLHYAHRSGIVHRDIKPANIMVDTEGVAKILDFGIARGVAAGLTQAGTVLGTLNYMSPEQLGGKVVDHRADIFSVGAVFYELLSGRLAFPGDVSSGILQVILAGRPEPLATLCPNLDAEVIAVVDRCLEKEADRRYKDLDAMRKDLAALRRRLDEPERDLATVPLRIPRPENASDPRPARTPGPDTRAELARLRRERIDLHLTEARTALDKGEFSAAREACRQALIMDPENQDAPDIQDQISLAEQARQLLTEAEDNLGKGALTAASMLVGRVLSTNPKLPEALRVRDAVEEARRKLEELQKRQRAIEDALDRARQHVATDKFDLAQAAIDEIAALEPAHEDLAALNKDLLGRQDAKRKRDDEVRAKQAVAQAHARFGAGEHEAALAALRAFAPPHPVVRDALVGLEVELREISRRAEELRRQQEARRKQDEEEARSREEAKREEEEAKRKAEEETRRKEEDARRKEDERRKSEEKRLAEAKKVEEKRLADEHRHAEERRKQEEATRLPDERRAQVDAKRAQEDARKKQETSQQTVIQVPGQTTVRTKATDPIGPATLVNPVGSKTVELSRDVTARLSRTPPKPEPKSRAGLFAGLGVATLVAIGIIWAVVNNSGSTPPPGPGPVVVPGLVQVAFDIRPWAEIQITSKASGQAVGGAKLETPCLVSLEPGEYHVRASNDFYPPFEFDVTVSPGDSKPILRLFPGMKPEDEANRILRGK